MKQCPKCNKTYANDKQKFCTRDGSALVDALEPRQDATIRMDSADLDDEITKVISQQLPRMTGSAFDPYKTQVSTDKEKTAAPPPPSEPLAPPPVAPPAPPPVAPPAPPPVAPPAPPRLADTISAPASVPPEPPPPSQPPASPVPPPPRPTVSASSTANIAQKTNASISADTRPAVVIPPVPPAAPAPPAFQPPVTQPKKRSKLPLILGILFVLLLIGTGGVVAGYFFVLKPMLEKRVIAFEPRRPEPTPTVTATPDVGTKPEEPRVEVPPYSPPAGAVQFVNSNSRLSGKLAEHFVEFSFYYPKSWHKDPDAGTATSTNFAKMQRQLAADAPQEIFAVGWYDSTGAKETDEASYARLVTDRSAQFAKAYPEYRKLTEGPTKAGPYDAYEFRFSGAYRNTTRGDIIIWGRVIFVPPVEGKRGVTLLMLASSLAPEVKGVDDVGVKGELPMMLESFRFAQ